MLFGFVGRLVYFVLPINAMFIRPRFSRSINFKAGIDEAVGAGWVIGCVCDDPVPAEFFCFAHSDIYQSFLEAMTSESIKHTSTT